MPKYKIVKSFATRGKSGTFHSVKAGDEIDAPAGEFDHVTSSFYETRVMTAKKKRGRPKKVKDPAPENPADAPDA